MINFRTNYPDLEKDLQEIIDLFSHIENVELELSQDIILFENSTKSIVRNGVTLFEEDCQVTAKNELDIKRQIKKFAKASLYRALKATLKADMPWGSITGVRPTKVASDLMKAEKLTFPQLLTELISSQNVSLKKAKLVVQTLQNQPKDISNERLINLYVNIPFCPSRCSYCSFISAISCNDSSLVEKYVDKLVYEIQQIKLFMLSKGYMVKSIYIGGGTPTVLNSQQLEKILKELCYNVKEFTVEAGRADTIDEEKMQLFKKYGVTRISINPQSFNVNVLKKANRNIPIDVILNSYKLALKYGFEVNMDIIAGLDGDNLASFKKTIATLLEFYPENISVHSLAIKKGSQLAIDGEVNENIDTEKMLDYAQTKLLAEGYEPYYMYKLKNAFKGLENVGFCRNGKVCRFNIDSMEEKTSIIALGANAVSKRVYEDIDRIDRQFNSKDIKTYIDKIDALLAEKVKMFE